MPSGTFAVGVRHDAEHDGADVEPGLAPRDADRSGRALGRIEVVLVEGADRQHRTPIALGVFFGHALARLVAARQHADDLVRVDEPAAPRLGDLAFIGRRRHERRLARPAPGQLEPARCHVRTDDLDLARRIVRPLGVEQLQPHDGLLDAEVADGREQLARHALRGDRVEPHRVRHVHHQPVPVQEPPRIADAEVEAQGTRALLERALEDRGEQLGVVALGRRARAHVAEHEQPLVFGILLRARGEAVDVLGRPQPLEVEIAVARQVDARGRLGVQAVQSVWP